LKKYYQKNPEIPLMTVPTTVAEERPASPSYSVGAGF